SAWAVDPHYGKKHGAIFEAREPFGLAGGTLLTFTLDQSIRVPQHGIGRFRLSVTTRQPPLPLDLVELSARDLEGAWADLGADTGRAELAIEALVLSRQGVPYLKSRLKAEPIKVDAGRLAALVRDLDDDKFTVRERATDELDKLGPAAAAALSGVLLDSSSL